jgi:hypothetical protein
MVEAGVPGQVLLLRPDLQGLVIDHDGSEDFGRDRNPDWSDATPGPRVEEPLPSGGQLYDFDQDR